MRASFSLRRIGCSRSSRSSAEWPSYGRGRGVFVQGLVGAGAMLLIFFGMSASAPTFWPLALAAAIVPFLPLPGRAPWTSALLRPLALLLTIIVTHAIFSARTVITWLPSRCSACSRQPRGGGARTMGIEGGRLMIFKGIPPPRRVSGRRRGAELLTDLHGLYTLRTRERSPSR